MGGARGDVYRTAKRRGVEDKIKKYEWQGIMAIPCVVAYVARGVC